MLEVEYFHPSLAVAAGSDWAGYRFRRVAELVGALVEVRQSAVGARQAAVRPLAEEVAGVVRPAEARQLVVAAAEGFVREGVVRQPAEAARPVS